MKNIGLIILTVFAMQTQAQWDSLEEIKFTSTVPRSGFTTEIILNKDSVKILEYSKRMPDKVNVIHAANNENWQTQLSLIKAESFDEIEKIKPPSSRRHVDGARHSELLFTDEKGYKYIHLFDNENPNEKLLPLMEYISKINESVR